MWKKLARKGKKHSNGVPLYLNVYDLTPINGYLYWFGLGIYHSAVEAYGVEYAFGAHDYPSTGVFEVEPRSCPGFTFRKSIQLGTIQLSPKAFRRFMVELASKYNGDTYHLIAKNCNHFCNDVAKQLTGSSIPGWVNRLAKLGSICNCLLPDSLQVNTVCHAPDMEGERTGSRSSCMRLSQCLVTLAPRRQRHMSVSSAFVQSLKGGVLPWNWKQTAIMNQRFRQLC